MDVDALLEKSCEPCEGGIPALEEGEVREAIGAIGGWEVLEGSTRIRRTWTVRNFKAGMAFLEEVAELAEREGHHPDLHLTGYRHVAIELTTHAIGGLSENDLILASKINRLPIEARE